MSKSKFTALSLCALMSVLALTMGIQAQDRPERPGGDNNRGNWESRRAEFEKRMNDRLKDSLKVTDEEWSVLQPRIQKVTELQRASRAGSMRGWGGRRNRGGDDDNQSERTLTPIQQSSKDLNDILEKEGATAEQIKAKLDAYRAARTAAEAQLTASRNELRELLTINQEARLVTMGILE
ncbi:MAG TPA: hypothetical protein DCM28_05040 [Phycisphaerales bacterium]|nr:hypothetical protein [Phycisphaerales bacterium]|tara:strand:+ start:526 stop:1065 length:540 start_codon:yes stop_codon:yes gene_type:complete